MEKTSGKGIEGAYCDSFWSSAAVRGPGELQPGSEHGLDTLPVISFDHLDNIH